MQRLRKYFYHENNLSLLREFNRLCYTLQKGSWQIIKRNKATINFFCLQCGGSQYLLDILHSKTNLTGTPRPAAGGQLELVGN